MKQLQWDKIPQQQAQKTVFNDDPTQEEEWLKKLQFDGVWVEMEEDFKAKQLVVNLMARQKQAELKSVLDPNTKKRVEILTKLVKNLSPEELAAKIASFDQDVCTQLFLSELKPILPTPEQVGKLNTYRGAPPEQLAELHPADRLMVQLIEIDRLRPRVEGMLYRTAFEECWTMLDEGARRLSEAGQALLNAKHFKELLSLILLIGNYMNGTGVKGGAFGFRVSSINKLVDTKSVNNTTLLHFLERTVSKHFPDMEEFLEELSRPAEAYRDNLQDVRKDLGNLREGLKKIRQELADHFANVEPSNQYGTKMWAFLKKATSRLEDLVDDVNAAESTYSEVAQFFGEDEKNMTSSEFYGIFKTFITSYRKCRMDNQTLAEQKASAEKRRIAAEELRAARQKAQAEASENEDTSVLDNLLEKLRSGENVGRRARRTRPNAATSTLTVDTAASFDKEDPAGAARDLLARLQSEGFAALAQTPPKPNPYSASRRNRRRPAGLEVTPESPSELDGAVYNDSVTLVDQSNGVSRTSSIDGDDGDSADVTIRLDSS